MNDPYSLNSSRPSMFPPPHPHAVPIALALAKPIPGTVARRAPAASECEEDDFILSCSIQSSTMEEIYELLTDAPQEATAIKKQTSRSKSTIDIALRILKYNGRATYVVDTQTRCRMWSRA
jgi:hypothetical protein